MVRRIRSKKEQRVFYEMYFKITIIWRWYALESIMRAPIQLSIAQHNNHSHLIKRCVTTNTQIQIMKSEKKTLIHVSPQRIEIPAEKSRREVYNHTRILK